MIKAWNIIDTGLRTQSTGHHYWETKALTDELLLRRADVRIFTCKNAPIERFPGVRVHPTFSLYYYTSISNDPSWGVLENFVVHNRSFQRDLLQVEQSLFHGSLTFFPTLSEHQLLGTIRWLAHFDDHARPKAVVTLEALADWSESNPSARIYRSLWTNCPAAVKKNLVLTVRERGTAGQFYRLLGVRPHVLPSPLGAHEKRVQIAANVGASPHGPLLVSFVGGSRLERGTMLIPDVVKLCAESDVRFFIQAKSRSDPGVDLGQLTALRGLPNVELHEGVLERDTYHDAIARSVVLIPYAPDHYLWRSSGVYVEAKFLGAPVIVAAGSWMAEEVKVMGNGLVFEDYSPAAIAACIARAQSEIGSLRERAKNCAREFSVENGPDRCVDAIESLFANGDS
jgi:glycosyltransferase involved in cell wall biosynthesis